MVFFIAIAPPGDELFESEFYHAMQPVPSVTCKFPNVPVSIHLAR